MVLNAKSTINKSHQSIVNIYCEKVVDLLSLDLQTQNVRCRLSYFNFFWDILFVLKETEVNMLC